MFAIIKRNTPEEGEVFKIYKVKVDFKFSDEDVMVEVVEDCDIQGFHLPINPERVDIHKDELQSTCNFLNSQLEVSNV